MLLGHGHPEIERAIRDQRERGDCLAGPTERMVQLAEVVDDDDDDDEADAVVVWRCASVAGYVNVDLS